MIEHKAKNNFYYYTNFNNKSIKNFSLNLARIWFIINVILTPVNSTHFLNPLFLILLFKSDIFSIVSILFCP